MRKIKIKPIASDPEGKRPRSFSYCPLSLRAGEFSVPNQIADKYADLLLVHGDAELVGVSGTLKNETKIKAHAGETVQIKPAKQVEEERDDGKSRGSVSEEDKK